MKRALILLLCLVMLCAAAAADAPYYQVSSILTGKAGENLIIRYHRNRTAPAGEMVILDAEGNELACYDVNGRQKDGSLSFPLDGRAENGQVVRICLRHDGVTELQGECLLAIDDGTPGVYKVGTNRKLIAITFDSANGIGRTANLLDLLDRFGVKCTFFLQGAYLKNHPQMAKEISDRGHELANHSMNHPDMRECDDAKIYREIKNCNDIIHEVTGQTVRFYRPPSGWFTYRDRAIARALGCEMIQWTFDSLDGFEDSTELMVRNAMKRGSEPGAIILMHLYGLHTLRVLEDYIPAMQALGYEFVTVGELLECQ